MDTVDALLDRRERVGDPESAVAVSMPVDADIAGCGLDDLATHEAHELAHALRCRVADGVGKADATGAGVDRRGVELLQDVGSRARRILRYVHDLQPLADREADRVLRRTQHAVERPVLGVLANWRRTDKRTRFDRHAG